ncbi:MAG TPA: PCRF domain-containing protein [Candidatus Paceibacterota bacterium]
MNQIDQDQNPNAGRIAEIEALMSEADFWNEKDKAQAILKEYNDLKNGAPAGSGPYDALGAVVTIFSGAGGDDSEDFSRMLFEMYSKYIARQGWGAAIVHEHQNDRGGFRNVTFDINGRNVYGTIKHESGVHRLVRLSPFNSKQLRHTSFSMVEVVPKFEKQVDFDLPEDELEVTFAKSGGPGGQNVNKRETAVRIVHKPTKLSVHVTSERSQAQNKEKAIAILKGKLFTRLEEERIAKEKGMYISKTTDIEWGNQIRSYVLHPYKMVKDHRTGHETSQVEKVLEGHIEEFIEAEASLNS